MSTVPPSRDDADRPFDAPVIRRRVVGAHPAPPPPSRPSAPRPARPSPPPSPPPPPPPTVVTSAPPAPARGGVLVGRINGQISVTKQQRHFFGLATLLAAAMAAVAAFCLYTTGVTFVVVLVGLFMVMVPARMFLGAWGLLVSAMIRGVVRLVAGLGALIVRGAGRTARGTVRATTSPMDVTVRRFQVQLISGEYITCLMAGEPTSQDPKKDDYVGISGRARKDHFAVRSLEIFSGPAGRVVGRVRAKQPLGVRIMRWLDRVSFVLAALIVAGALALVW